MTAAADDIVTFDNVGLRYGADREILSNVSFTLYPGSFYFLTGASGAGKTSLLRLLFLSIRPTRGLVNLFGQDVSLLGKDQVASMRQRIGIVLQDFRLLDHMTTYENVALPFRVMGRDYDAAVIAAGHCGFGMGATPNAMANMQAFTAVNGPSVKAFFVIPLVGSLFIDFFNAVIITGFMNYLK